MANVDLKTNFKNGDKLYDYELNNNFKAIKAALEAMNKIVWQNDDNASLVMFAGTTEQITNRELIEGQLLYNTQTGETYIDAMVDTELKRISTGGGTSIQIGGTQPTNPATKLWVEDDLLDNIGTEVVNTLTGNETNKAPSVNAVNKAIEKNVMKIIYSGEYYNLTTNNQYETVKFDNMYFSIGDKLTFDSINNAIKIGEGISKIKIHVELSMVKQSAGLVYVQLRTSSGTKRGWNVYAGIKARTKAIGDEYLNVVKDDLIQVYTYGSTTDEITGGSCFTSLVVEVIE